MSSGGVPIAVRHIEVYTTIHAIICTTFRAHRVTYGALCVALQML
jgi:hypothetical protein